MDLAPALMPSILNQRRTWTRSVGTKNKAPSSGTFFRSFQGRVHALGRWTEDGFSASHALHGGRWTVDGERLLLFSFLPDPKPQTRYSTLRHPPFTSHQTPLFAREAILACVSRLAKAKPLLATERSSRQKRSLSLFLVGSCY